MKEKLSSLAQQAKFVYDDRSHKYTLAGRVLGSTTHFVSSQFAPFDPQLAARTAKKEGKTEIAVQAAWRHKGVIGRECGTLTHEWLERRVAGGATRPCDPSSFHTDSISKFVEMKALGVPQAMLDIYTGYGFDVVLSETSLWGNKLGGTLDILARRSGDELWIVDWKTGDKDPSVTYGKPKARTIIGDLPDNDLSKWTLQLATYRSMIWRLLGEELEGALIIKGGLEGVAHYELAWKPEWMDLLLENT